MNRENIIFLGIIDNIEDFCSIFGKEQTNENIFVCEDISLYNNENIITITEEEIKEQFGNYKDITELREKAIKYFGKNIQGQTFDIGEYKNIRINRRSRDKYESFSADERKLLIIPKLLEILKTSKYKNSSLKYKERKDKMVQFHYFTNKVLIQQKNTKNFNEYKVYIIVGEDNQGNLFWDLEENKKPLETLHQTNDVFSKGNNSIT